MSERRIEGVEQPCDQFRAGDGCSTTEYCGGVERLCVLKSYMGNASSLANEVHERFGPISEPTLCGRADWMRDNKYEAVRLFLGVVNRAAPVSTEKP